MKLFITVFFGLALLLMPTVYAEGAIDADEQLRDLQQKRNITIAAEQRDAVVLQCGQGKLQLKSIQHASDSAIKKRLAVYSDIQKELKAIELRMTKQGADASEIDLLIGKLQQNIDTFTEQSRYLARLAEITDTIDCTANPEQYRAATGEYTDTRQDLHDSAEDLKSTILDAPQTTFLPLIDRLRI